jgi:BASS family bile acid:Na+ symporter
MSARDLVILALQASIIVTVFGFGLRASLADVVYVVRRPSLLLRSVIAMFVVMPVVAVVLAQAFDFRHPVEAALVALSISPVPPLLPRRHDKAGGQVSYGLGLMVTMALLSIVIIPLAVQLIDMFYGKTFSIQPAVIAKIVFTMAVLPLLAGMLCNRFIPKLAHAIARPAILAGKVLLPLAGVVVIVAAHRALGSLLGDGTLVAIVVFVAIALAVGHALGGPDPEEREVLALSTACRHPGIAIALAAANATSSADHQVPAAIMLYLLVSIVATVPYVKWQAKRLGAAK